MDRYWLFSVFLLVKSAPQSFKHMQYVGRRSVLKSDKSGLFEVRETGGVFLVQSLRQIHEWMKMIELRIYLSDLMQILG